MVAEARPLRLRLRHRAILRGSRPRVAAEEQPHAPSRLPTRRRDAMNLPALEAARRRSLRDRAEIGHPRARPCLRAAPPRNFAGCRGGCRVRLLRAEEAQRRQPFPGLGGWNSLQQAELREVRWQKPGWGRARRSLPSSRAEPRFPTACAVRRRPSSEPTPWQRLWPMRGLALAFPASCAADCCALQGKIQAASNKWPRRLGTSPSHAASGDWPSPAKAPRRRWLQPCARAAIPETTSRATAMGETRCARSPLAAA